MNILQNMATQHYHKVTLDLICKKRVKPRFLGSSLVGDDHQSDICPGENLPRDNCLTSINIEIDEQKLTRTQVRF